MNRWQPLDDPLPDGLHELVQVSSGPWGYNGTNHCNLDAAGGVYVAPDQGIRL